MSNYHFTKKGLQRTADYLAELEDLRRTILAAGKDTAEEVTGIPTLVDVLEEIAVNGLYAGTDFFGDWNATDNMSLDYPLILTLGSDLAESVNWRDLKYAALAGRLKVLLPTGDTIDLVLDNDDKVDLMVGYDEKGKAYFVFNRAMSECRAMDVRRVHHGYAVSAMAMYADKEVFPMLPPDLQTVIDQTRITQIVRGQMIASSHKLFCLSYTQVFGKTRKTDVNDREPEDSPIDIFRSPWAQDKIQAKTGEKVSWWLRTPHKNTSFYSVYATGGTDVSSSDEPKGVVLAFCLEP